MRAQSGQLSPRAVASASVSAPAGFKRPTEPLKSVKGRNGTEKEDRSALVAIAGAEEDISGVPSTFRRLHNPPHITDRKSKSNRVGDLFSSARR